MAAPRFPSALQAILVVNLAGVTGLTLGAIYGPASSLGLRAFEALAVTALCAGSGFYILRRGGEAAVGIPDEKLEALRRENADNLGVLQRDLRSLGTAVISRLDNAAPAGDTEALSGAMTDLAISLAEARETLAAMSAELAEVKSVAFEMQAQIDQQADALRAFEHSVERIRPEDADAGEGAAPGSLGKALAAGISGSAVARLIGNGFHASESAPEPAVAATDVESDYGAPEAPIPAADFEAGDLVAEHEGDIAVASDPIAEEVAEETETDDWLSMGLEEEEEPAPAATQPGLLEIADESETRRKPRRPGKHDTALIAHVMIGIGNKPYLRGQGPGLSPDKGVPMEYVDVGRWQWIAPESGSPLTVTLWKNDEVPADGGTVGVPSGMTLEIHPHFAG